MNFKIEKIREAELQTDKLVAQEKKMRRAFMADGTVDAKEQKQLDDVDGKISKLKGAVAKIRAEIEAARRAWEGRGADWSRLQAETAELGGWGHKDHPKVKAETDKIPPLTGEQQWEEATKQLDAALKVLNPAMEDYRKQVAAKREYDPLRADTDTRVDRSASADPMTPDIESLLATQQGELGVIDKSLGDKDYVTALASLKGMETNQAKLEEMIKEARGQKADFDKEMGQLSPRLKEALGCVLPEMTPTYAKLGTQEAQIAEAAGKHDYIAARGVIAETAVNVDLYMAEYAAAVDAQTLYNARLPRIDQEMAGITQNRYPDLADQLQKIVDTDNQMRGMAGAGSFEQANEEMAKLDPMIEGYKEAEENARLGEDYAARKAQIEPRMAKVRVSEYPPLDEMQLKINDTHAAAEKAAGAKDYTEGLSLLDDVEVGLGDFDTKYAAQQKAQTDYENGIVQIKPRYEGIANSKYPQLAEQEMSLIAAYDRMNAAGTARDFVAGFAAMTDVEHELGIIETAREAIEAKQMEYETRKPPLIQRFDAGMVSDYAQLEDERARLQTARADMEAAEAGRDFPLALDHLNAVERMLNDLDSQLGDLTKQKKQYEAMLAQIEAGLKAVEGCQHTELAAKKQPIMDIRADMLALAQEEDFGVALERANTLVPLLNDFAKLEAQLEEYHRRLEALKPRLETVKGFTYKSLKEKQDAITKLYGEMTAQAAKAELTDALAKMGEIEKLVTEIIKLQDDLRLQEAVYKKLHGDLQGKMKPYEGKDKFGNDEVDAAVKAAKESMKKLEELGGKDEFIEAVKQADDVAAKIEAIRTAMEAVKDAKAAYEMLKGMADAGYAEAKKKAEEYEDLQKDYDGLTKLHEQMTKAGEGDTPNYDDAKAKAQTLLDKLEAFDGKWQGMAEREASLTASAEAAYRRFDALPEDAKDKAKDEYDDAVDARDDLKTALDKKKLDRAEEKLADLNTALDKLEGAVKTKEQHKADYDTRLGALQPRVDKAKESPFKAGLAKELEVVTSALEAMTERGEAEDYEGGVKAAPAVDSALSAFDVAEDKLEQLDAVLKERIGEIDKDMPKLDEAPQTPEFIALIGQLRGLYDVMKKQYAAQKLNEADATSIDVRDKLRSILDQIEAAEDAKAAEDEKKIKEEEDKGILDRAKDLAEDVVDEVVDRAKDEVKDYISDKLNAPREIIDGVEKIWDGDYIDGAKEIVKGVDDALPIPVSKNVRRAAKVAEEVYDFVKDKF